MRVGEGTDVGYESGSWVFSVIFRNDTSAGPKEEPQQKESRRKGFHLTTYKLIKLICCFKSIKIKLAWFAFKIKALIRSESYCTKSINNHLKAIDFLTLSFLIRQNIFAFRRSLWTCVRSCSLFLCQVLRKSARILWARTLGPSRSLCFLLAQLSFQGSSRWIILALSVPGSCRRWCTGRSPFCLQKVGPF